MIEKQVAPPRRHGPAVLRLCRQRAARFVAEEIVRTPCRCTVPIGGGQTISQPTSWGHDAALHLERAERFEMARAVLSGRRAGFVAKTFHHRAAAELASALCQACSLGYFERARSLRRWHPGFRNLLRSTQSSSLLPASNSKPLSTAGEGGRLIIPLGGVEHQELQLIEKKQR